MITLMLGFLIAGNLSGMFATIIYCARLANETEQEELQFQNNRK